MTEANHSTAPKANHMFIFNVPPLARVYEHPFSERVALMLRLEAIFDQILRFKSASNQYDTQLCLNALYDLFTLNHRYELRVELLREIDRMRNVLQQMQRVEIDEDNAIADAIQEFDTCANALHELSSESLSKNDIKFAQVLRHRDFYQQSHYLFELPAQQHWLLQSAEQRKQQIDVWMEDFMPLKSTVDFLLDYIRCTGEEEEITVDDGVCIRRLNLRFGKRQLARVILPTDAKVFPRVSGDNTRFVVRFMSQEQLDTPATQADYPVEFLLQTCGM